MSASSAQPPAQPLQEVERFGGNPGNLRMYLYKPPALPRGAPLVVLVHGCTATARETGVQSGWLRLADEHRFAVLLPETSRANEPLGGCFRTWEPEHQARGAGEPLSIRQMIAYAQKHDHLSKRHVFITGMSSGGHVVNVMLAAYPDLFAAGAPLASFPYKCALKLSDLRPCATGEVRRTPTEWGALVRGAYPGFHGRRPRVQIWHGDEDPLINVAGQARQAAQWRNVLGLAEPGVEGMRAGLPVVRYANPKTGAVVETVTVPGMGHAMPVDPGPAKGQCGETGPYASDVGVCAAFWIGRFFGIIPEERRR
ncbi:MAG: hypothetical protein B7Z13_16060 [Caulobacterales bacterium 32-67-6]|nr:MAG: hypothetical protein B7Z13_16060 [Caulobacterales bacterium 32-67-6]